MLRELRNMVLEENVEDKNRERINEEFLPCIGVKRILLNLS